MFVCLDCGKLFDEPEHWVEKHGFTHGPFEHFSGCPYCGEAYTETYLCDGCGEWIVGDYIKTVNGDRFCENCYNAYEMGDEE